MTDKHAPPSSDRLSYRDAGVDIEAGNRLVDLIKPMARATHRAGVLGGLGGFGGLFELPEGKYRQPVLVAGTDGVGTKLKLAIEMNKHDTIGIDLVAMCVNDIIVTGAEPLFFLDYYATGHLSPQTAAQVIQGISHGCQVAGTSLLGGETAEMPGMYNADDYDLAGFCVGVVEKDDIIDGSEVSDGDILVALPSSGPHSNGYSLIRRIVTHTRADLNTRLDQRTLGETLLAPTCIYVKAVLALRNSCNIKAIAHITGGGLLENIPRVLPAALRADIDTSTWQWPPIFSWLQDHGNVDNMEMYRTFNCGVGMILCIPPADLESALASLGHHGIAAWAAGQIKPRTADQDAVTLDVG